RLRGRERQRCRRRAVRVETRNARAEAGDRSAGGGPLAVGLRAALEPATPAGRRHQPSGGEAERGAHDEQRPERIGAVEEEEPDLRRLGVLEQEHDQEEREDARDDQLRAGALTSLDPPAGATAPAAALHVVLLVHRVLRRLTLPFAIMHHPPPWA